MSENLREKQTQQRRTAILDACFRELSEQNEEEITVDAVAGRAGVSRATVFNYFPSKRDIVLAIADDAIDDLETYLQGRSKADSPEAIIREVMFRLVGESVADSQATWRVLKRLLDDPSGSVSPVWRLLRLIEELVRSAQAQHEFRADLDPGGCARAIIGTYLAELFVIAAHPGTPELVSRADFDVVATQLMSSWSRKNA